MDHAARRWPELNLHLSVQASGTNCEALRFYHECFGIRRAVLPRVLSLAQVRHVVENGPVDIEVFGFGSLCVMVEGRCILSSYVTGESPNTCGACSPASHVEWRETPQGRESRLGGLLTDRYAPGEQTGYPTVCKGRYEVAGRTSYAIEEPTSLNTLQILPDLFAAGVRAIKIEGRQRSPAYVGQVTRVWRAAIDACTRDPDRFRTRPDWVAQLDRVPFVTGPGVNVYNPATLEVLAINGIQTLSARTCNLLPELGDMKRMGVDVVRISPQSQHTDRVVELFASVLEGPGKIIEAQAELQRWIPVGACDGYWHGRPGRDLARVALSGEAFVQAEALFQHGLH